MGSLSPVLWSSAGACAWRQGVCSGTGRALPLCGVRAAVLVSRAGDGELGSVDR